MKILTLVYSIGPGGTERAAVNYAVAYKRYGCDSRVWVVGGGFDRLQKLIDNNVMVYRNDENTHAENEALVLTWQPDIIHIHHFDNNLVSIAKKAIENGAKLVETNVFSRPRYSDEFKQVSISFQLAYWGLYKYFLWMKKSNQNALSIRLPYIVDINDFEVLDREANKAKLYQQYDIPVNGFVAARVGQAHPSKWDVKIFDVIEKTVAKNELVYFILVGLPEAFKPRIEALSVAAKKNVRLINFINGDKALTEFYSGIDVFVHISHIGESFGYVLTEAMSCGCPVITLNTPLKDNAQFEVIENECGGFCVNNVTEFVQKLLLLAKDRNYFEPASLRNHVQKRFSEEALMPKLLNVYTALQTNNQLFLNSVIQNELDVAKKIVKKQFVSLGNFRTVITIVFFVIHIPIVNRLISKLKRV